MTENEIRKELGNICVYLRSYHGLSAMYMSIDQACEVYERILSEGESLVLRLESRIAKESNSV